ncbi:MAG: hypothetical protein JSR87_05045 [Proteobacteria bacterium]|nr:hypothetical protein [Pseudomonadota bacterium]MBS0574469.1 hypothetical protein [Pseudomonadota bacterium]
MSAQAGHAHGSEARRGAGAALWPVLALAGLLSVFVANGRALFYFDTVGYVSQGDTALAQLGVIRPPPPGSAEAGQAMGTGGSVKTVDGSRSPSYSLLAGIFSHLGFLEGILLVNAAALALASGLVARVMVRRLLPGRAWPEVAAMPLALASLGSLPFFAAYLMPDLLAPVMLVTLAALAVFAPDMRRGELVLAYVLASFAAISHLSHFPVAGLVFLASVPLAFLTRVRRWWLGPGVIALVLATAWAQQAAFRLMAAKVAHSEVVIRPFLTARLIQDGPGYTYLKTHCPDAVIVTCRLWEALQISDDPYRLTASHIVFETSRQLGSFQLMSADDKKAVADAQVGFLKAVVREHPLGVGLAFARNVLAQAGMVSVDMTLPTAKIEMRNAEVGGSLAGPLAQGRLRPDAPWLPGLTRAQSALYVGSLGFCLALMVLPGALPGRMRLFALMILAGLIANAVVCGGISQPASRYGARVVWLLPWLAVLAGLVASRRRGGEA